MEHLLVLDFGNLGLIILEHDIVVFLHIENKPKP